MMGKKPSPTSHQHLHLWEANRQCMPNGGEKEEMAVIFGVAVGGRKTRGGGVWGAVSSLIITKRWIHNNKRKHTLYNKFGNLLHN